MTSRERVISCCERRGFDRIPVKHEGTPEVNGELRRCLSLSNDEQLLAVLGDDFRYVEPVYIGPPLRTFPDGSVEGYFGERYAYKEFEGGKYLESVYQPFKDVLELADLDRSRFPRPDWFDYSTIKAQAATIRKRGYAVCAGTAGDMDFINGISRARGMEQVLLDLIDDSQVLSAIMQARFELYYGQHKLMLEEADGLIDFMHVGDDLGTQLTQMISFDIFDRHFAPKYGEYFRMVHDHGARTMMHMCGAVWMFLPRLVRLGLDVYDVVQPTTPENDIGTLAATHGDSLVFQGSMDVQKEIAFGTVDDVVREVDRRLALFPRGGLILGPSHAVQAKSPIENALAMYRTAGSLLDPVPQWVFDIEDETDTGISISKLF